MIYIVINLYIYKFIYIYKLHLFFNPSFSAGASLNLL